MSYNCHVADNTDNESKDDEVKSQVDDELTPEEKEKLDKEEQMAQFEEALKNSDWGHQPC